MKSLIPLALFFLPFLLWGQAHSFHLALGYDEYKAPYLPGDIAIPGTERVLFMTRTDLNLAYQFETKNGFRIRPRLGLGFHNIPYHGLLGRNPIALEYRDDDEGTTLEGMLDFGNQAEIIPQKLTMPIYFGFGFASFKGAGWYKNSPGPLYTTYYRYNMKGFGLVTQFTAGLEYHLTPAIRIALEQRHELSFYRYIFSSFVYSYNGSQSSVLEDNRWDIFSFRRFINYMPPLLRISYHFGKGN